MEQDATVVYGSLDELIEDDNNANKGTERGKGMLDKSIAGLGIGRGIVVDKNNRIIGGNKTWQSAADAGLHKVVFVETSGDALVVTKRTDLDLQDKKGRARRLAYLDNQVSHTSYLPDPDVILRDITDGVDLSGIFTDKELKQIQDAVRIEPHEDDAPSIPESPTAELGDVYLLGRHRLVCGDCTDSNVVRLALGDDESADMIWTDPPWNVAYVGISKSTKPIQNDNLGDAFPEFCAKFCTTFASAIRPGHVIYVAMGPSEWPVLDAAIRSGGFHWSSTIIWAKDSLVVSRKDYHPQYEPIWYGWLEGAARRYEVTDRKQSDLWEIPRPRRSEEHPTMKPVEPVARAVQNSSAPGDLVFDPFGGSGTTLIACEQTKRRCATIELDPRYVDVIVKRWENLTGSQAVRHGQEP